MYKCTFGTYINVVRNFDMNKTNDIFWDVKEIAKYEFFFSTGIKGNNQFHRTYELVKNLSYNLQYLEFISKVLNKEIHAVIKTEMIKTFVITGMSVIESILYYTLKSKNLHKTEPYEEIALMNSNEKKINDVFIKVETRLLKKLEENKEVEMNLSSMLQKTESNKLIGNDHSIYSQLNHLRKLRNKIHLYLIEENLDHDWNRFGVKEISLMKKSLHKILYSELFDVSIEMRKELFDFLEE